MPTISPDGAARLRRTEKVESYRGGTAQRRASMRIAYASLAVLLTALIASCSSFGKSKPEPVIDPNAYPANYRKQIATFLQTTNLDRADYSNAFISMPALKPVGDSQRYVVCVQFNGYNQQRTKVAIYFAASVAQFVDAKPEQCADAAYQPFTELAVLVPSR